MSSDYSSIIPHAAPGPEDPSLQTGKVRSMLKRILRNGLDMPVRFLQSIRIGSGTGLAGMDGQNGAIIANGSSAKLVMGDQANPSGNAWAAWRDNSSLVYLDSSTGNTVAQLDTLAMATVLRKSLRVGNSNGLSGFDGTDGAVASHGTNAGFYWGNRTSASDTSYGAWLYDGTTVAFQASKFTGNILQANATTAALLAARSIRAGTGTGLAAYDGTDGRVIASGAAGTLMFGDVAAPTAATYGQLYRSASSIILNSSEGGTLWTYLTTNGAAVGKSSVRVGTGTGLGASLDGGNGSYIASGTSAGYIFGDQTNPANTTWGQIFRSGNLITIGATEAGIILQVAANTLAASGPKSIRAGSGLGLSTYDGQDGFIMAAGPAAGFYFGDRGSPGTAAYGALLRSGTNVGLYTNDGGQLLAIVSTSGAMNAKTSIRAGSTNAIGQDGTDGGISADGALAALWFKDRSNNNFSGWYRTSDSTRLYANTVGDVWQISTAGIINQAAWTAMSPNTSITNNADAGSTPSGTRLDKPTGKVTAVWNFMPTTAYGGGWAALQMSGAHVPSKIYPVTLRRSDGTLVSAYLHPNGWLVVDPAALANAVYLGTLTYYQS